MSDKNVKALLIGLAEVFGEQLTEQRLLLYAQMLSGFSAPEIEEGIKRILENPAITKFPLPAQIRESVKPTLSIDVAAQELLQRCLKAVSLFGYSDSVGARTHIGETAWRAIGGRHGWVQFCCAGDFSVNGLEIGTARAQLREALKAKLIQNYPSGRVEALPTPPGGTVHYLAAAGNSTGPYLAAGENEMRLRQLNAQLKNIGVRVDDV